MPTANIRNLRRVYSEGGCSVNGRGGSLLTQGPEIKVDCTVSHC